MKLTSDRSISDFVGGNGSNFGRNHRVCFLHSFVFRVEASDLKSVMIGNILT